MSRIRAAFFGTPVEAIPILGGLMAVANVDAVVTRPDAPQGRSREPVPPPVKTAAEALGIPVLQPDRPAEVLDQIEPLDVVVLAAYGLLIPASLLNAPEFGFLNIHYSLLPRWRGASPVVRAILAGDETTGVSLIQMDEGLDTGPIFATSATPIDPEETAGELTTRLAGLGGDLVATAVPRVVGGDLRAEPQDDALATAAAKVEVEEAFLDPRRHTATAVHRAIRAFNPKPGAWGVVDGGRIKIWRAVASEVSAESGMAVVADGTVILGCTDGAVELKTVQPSGRAAMDATAWMNGRRGEPAVFASA
ncbi:MAG TPA: methionyl-tRNA formyltransferase [Acidimicrobiia bacterium]|nr:methionyl-tRNA formyltransferase [Acidimicrobiia bacterium]